MNSVKESKAKTKGIKTFATIAIFAATLAMVGTTTLSTTVPVFAAECSVNPPTNSCTVTGTPVTEELNAGQDEKTTTTTTKTCQESVSDTDLKGPSGDCPPPGDTTRTGFQVTTQSSDCDVVARKAHHGAGQVTGRECTP
jgi:hypothetical protein